MKGDCRAFLFKDGNMTACSYKRMRRYFLFVKLRDYPESIIFQKDGSLQHYANELREYPERKLPGQWMRRVGWISSPAHMPDLTPSYYYL